MHAGIRRGPWLAALLAVAWAAPASAQLDLDSLQVERSGRGAATAKAVAVQADIVSAADGRGYALKVTAEIAPGYHIYSLTQPAGGPIASKITLDKSDEFKLDGEFKPSVEPQVYPEAAFDNLMVESHEGELAWSAPIQLASGVDPAKLVIKGSLGYQACDASSCLPPSSVKFAATLGSDSAATTTSSKSIAVESPPQAAPAAVFRDKNSRAELAAHIEPRAVAPGGQATLVVTITPDTEWHAYAWAARDPVEVAKPTLILFSEKSGFSVDLPIASSEPIEKTTGEYPERYHEGAVTWRIALDAPKSLAPGHYPIAGLIGYQVCRATGCDLPRAVHFSAELTVGTAEVPGQTPVTFGKPAPYAQATKLADEQASESPPASSGAAFDPNKFKTREDSGSFLSTMGGAFLAGLILNLMPCVLPVIGLKILSFVEQGGRSRSRILTLNLWYSAGMVSVFVLLALLLVVVKIVWGRSFGWGEQFSYDAFNITLAAVVFVMALSFLGVWEIPIPGFVGSNKAGQLASREGASGAFAKGVITTVLATPCGGPFVATAIGFAAKSNPAVTFAVFIAMGVGMASPYLLIGAFPRLIQFLPKPGAWMDTFKQFLGFVLLGTVVFLLSVVHAPNLIPALTLLIGLWGACWWIGRTPGYAETIVKLRAWAIGAVVAAAVGFVAFEWVGPEMQARFDRSIDAAVGQRIAESQGTDGAGSLASIKVESHGDELPWRPLSLGLLEQLTNDGKTVMVDFTADWCQTCKALEKFVLNTPELKKFVEENEVVPLMADMTRYPPAETDLLEKLSGARIVPVLAIFPAGRPNEPIVLAETYTKGLLIEKLKAAGPSQMTAREASATTAAR